jgi:hypothetical protein
VAAPAPSVVTAEPVGPAPGPNDPAQALPDETPDPPDRAWHWDRRAWLSRHQRTSFELEYAPASFRAAGSTRASWDHGSEVAFGSRSITHASPFLLSLSTRPTLRVLDAQSFALSMVQTVSVALSLGPLEPEVGGGFATITADIVHGHISAELLSPRAIAGLWLHLGRLRVGAHAYGEVLWRWFGNDSYFFRGVAIEVGVEAPRARRREPR